MAARREEGEVGRRIVFSYPLTAQTDMHHKMKLDCQEICSNVMEKHSNNEEVRKVEDNLGYKDIFIVC